MWHGSGWFWLDEFFNTSPCAQAAANKMHMCQTFYLIHANDMQIHHSVGTFKAMHGCNMLSQSFGATLTLFNFLNFI